MTEQALIERIVADVMRQLMADASSAPEPSVPAPSATNRQVQVADKRTSSVRLDVKVVTEDTLQESVNGHKTVEVGVKAIVTPSGRDIQGEGIAPDRQLSDPEPLNPGGEGDRWLTEAEQWMVALLEQDPSDSNA